MIYLKKILFDNGISMQMIARLLNINKCSVHERLNCKHDFTLNELKTIRNYLIDLKIISIDFDLGDLLNECEEEKKN